MFQKKDLLSPLIVKKKRRNLKSKYMPYPSIDKVQNVLAEEVFGYAKDRKKAAGRALGTFIEIINFYLKSNCKVEI